MRFEHIVFVAAALAATLSIGCTDTCRQRCDFAADFYESCLPEWNSSWSNLGYDDKSGFMSACMGSVDTARGQVTDCCTDAEEDSNLSQEEIDEYMAECEHNTLLAIDRNCEDNKEYYRQPCSDYWQQVFDPAAEAPPEDNPTCQDVTGDDDDLADDDTAG